MGLMWVGWTWVGSYGIPGAQQNWTNVHDMAA